MEQARAGKGRQEQARSCSDLYTLKEDYDGSHQPQSRQHYHHCMVDLWDRMKYHSHEARTAALPGLSLVWFSHSLPPSFVIQETRQNATSGLLCMGVM